MEERQPTIFDAVSKHDLEGILRHYLQNARTSIASFMALSERWSQHHHHHHHRRHGEHKQLGGEEKLDEYLQHIADESTRWTRRTSSAQAFAGTTRTQDVIIDDAERCYEYALQEIDVLLSDLNGSGSESESESGYDMAHGRHSGPGGFKTGLSTTTSKSSTTAFGGDGNSSGNSSSNSSSSSCHWDGVDRIVWQSMGDLTNSKPPQEFVVYNRRGDTTPSDDNPGPPIFDGQVANATPPPLGSSGIRPSGGAGTLAHLACAVDCSFGLALALILGVDARSPHTAFRRLIIHESACCGSHDSLALLLELGKKCAHDMFRFDQLLPRCRHGQDFSVNNSRSPGSSSTTTTDNNNSAAFPPFDYADQMPSLAIPIHHPSSPSSSRNSLIHNKTNARKRPGTRISWVDMFRDFIHLARSANRGTISKLDAARAVLKYDTISDSTKHIIAQSCSFLVKDSTMAGNPYNSPWYADGHGNTPLHWAAFKNEERCVALLLHYHADPNARAHPSGWTALHDAAYSNSAESLVHLLDAGADVDVRANSGATPLCFAAQEDSDKAARILLERGADITTRCSGGGIGGPHHHHHHHANNGRFTGYNALHYSAHYNAHRAASILLVHPRAKFAMEIPDVNNRLPIHVAVARGSSDVLKELLHAGARIDMPYDPPSSPHRKFTRLPSYHVDHNTTTLPIVTMPPTQTTHPSTSVGDHDDVVDSTTSSDITLTPVSSPILRSMIPPRPITSSKPWNCLTQRSIDECKRLISSAEQSWSPDRHLLFTPTDRRAIMELLRVGKRLELIGTGIFVDLWPLILSFCGRGWFVAEQDVVSRHQLALDDNVEMEEA